MDAFFASVEQRDHPELRGKPVAVGGGGDRGVVAAASYEARKYGVRSAMASRTARQKCPHLIFVKSRFEVYKQVSAQIRAIFADYTPLIEPLSLDEAYLDVTENLRGIKSATLIAQEIKQRIRQATQLTASAGVSYNKFLAKLASDHRKPDGIFVIKPEEGKDFVAQLPIERFHGIGRVTAQKMHELGILTGLDLRQQTESFLRQHFGKAGGHYFRIARAEDERPVEPDRVRKSVGSENTFAQDLDTLAEMQGGLIPLLDDVWKWCERTGVYGRTVTVKIKLNDFQIMTRSRSSFLPIRERGFFENLAFELLEENFPLPLPVRLLGVSLSNLEDSQPYEGKQLTLTF
ncbi:DNA polymerase IV [Salmonirosea aquatica]|uniref:DNA polymerase IV n=1 Tax=Salmonirosea aquatica TaxID=2654236 RepID=A0A7C9BG96_9BACT|nr:DNA polymerase IV [Cytophagaceae bacterium SJW1-29]